MAAKKKKAAPKKKAGKRRNNFPFFFRTEKRIIPVSLECGIICIWAYIYSLFRTDHTLRDQTRKGRFENLLSARSPKFSVDTIVAGSE